MRRFLRDIGVITTSVGGKHRVSIVEVKNDIVTLSLIIVIISAASTLLLLFISSLGGESFDQTWKAYQLLHLY